MSDASFWRGRWAAAGRSGRGVYHALARRSKLHHEWAWANLELARANQRGVLFVYLLASGLFGVATFSVGLAVAG